MNSKLKEKADTEKEREETFCRQRGFDVRLQIMRRRSKRKRVRFLCDVSVSRSAR